MFFKNLFLFEIWRVVKILIPNLTRREKFNSKTLFQINFSDSRWIIINVLPNTKLLDNDDGLRQKDFLRVCGMCLSHVWYNLFGYCLL